jgi:phenylalanyl-tRNA synthetase beta chain
VSEKDLDSLGISKHPVFSKVVKLKNALNSEEGLMHTTLVPALLKAAGRNASSQSRGARLFETGRGYFSTKPTHSLASIQNSYGCRPTVFTDRALNDPSRVFEYNLLGFVLDQPGRQKNWKTGEGEVDLFEVKSQMLEWCHRIGLRNVVLQRLNFSKDFSEFLPFLHPLNSFVCLADDGKLLGYFGAVHPKTASDYKFEPSQPPVVGEFLLDVVFQVVQASKKEFVPQFLRAEFPSLTRDLCLVMPESLPYAEIEKKLSSVPRKAHLSSVKAFDVYQGKALGEGLKSITLSLQFRSSKKTLTEKDIEFEWAELVKWLTAGDLGVRVRA